MRDNCKVKRGRRRCCFIRVIRKELPDDAISAQCEEAMCGPTDITTVSWDKVLLGIFKEQVKEVERVKTRRIRGQSTNGPLAHGCYVNQ